jgi:AcrR family transcriptional regulator
MSTKSSQTRRTSRLSGPSDRHFQEVSTSSGDGKRSRTRALLLDTAIEVFAKKGLEAASILEITEAAGLSNGSFYYHFPDKAALINAVGQAISSILVRETDAAMSQVTQGAERVAFGVMFFINHAASNASWGRLITLALDERGEFQDQFMASMRKDVQLGIAQGDLNVTPSPALHAILLGIIRAALQEMLHQPRTKAIDVQAVEAILRVLGLKASKAQALTSLALERISKH